MSVTAVSVPTLEHVINNTPVVARGATIDVLDPSTNARIAALPIASAGFVDRAVEAAQTASRGWGRATPAERATALNAIADAIDANADRLARLESLDVGKPIQNARAEMPGISDTFRFYAAAARTTHGTASGRFAEGLHSRVEREPVGVVGLITPWNYPLLEAVWKLGPALAAGNTVVLKPSEITPLTTAALFSLMSEILPAGVANLVLGDASTGRAIVDHPGTRMVSLTGDVGTGVAVATGAAVSLKRVHLELGGKSPVVVLPDSDVETAAEFLASAGFVNSGQDCTAACRLIVHDAIYDEFVDRYQAQMKAIRVGSALDDATTMGPLVSDRQRQRAEGFVDRARSAGASILAGGRTMDRPGFFYEPTLVADVDQHSEIIQKEVFGPVVTVQRAADADQALAWANDVPYGLSASVWTNDVNEVHRFTRDLSFGTVWVNTHLWTVPEMPFGGFDGSGYGKELSGMSIEDYSRYKHVMLQER
ncbi:aldehyde dehydrogenase family protein [Microbacterium sp. X-17]|uniref:aldehyde dehydrogenase family protein n=1 Tax=Microbacterium sp. X-17 TaxID=3144404 RepID=UPI0031F5D53B